MYVVLLIALTLCTQIQAAQAPVRSPHIPIEVPAIFGTAGETLDTTTEDLFSSTTFADLISAQHAKKEPYLLARVVTPSNITGIFYIHYFDAHGLCLYLNTFTENKGSYPLLATGRNALLYNPAKGTYPLTGEHDPFFKNPSNYQPITFGIQFFTCAAGQQKPTFTYLCSQYDLFINQTSGAYWRTYFQANQNDDEKRKKEAVQTLEKLAAAQPKPTFPKVQEVRNSVPVYLPPHMGAQEFLNLAHQDPLTKQSFAQRIKEQAVWGNTYLVARIITQNDAGQYTVTYVDAHEANKKIFQAYPFTYPRTAFEENYALCYNIQADRRLQQLERKAIFLAPWDNKTPLSRNILYFSYDPQLPDQGFTYLCSHYDLFINALKPREGYVWNTSIQDYWETVFYANQNHNEQLKKRALTKLQTAPLQKIDKEIKKIAAPARKQEQAAREKAKIEQQKKLEEQERVEKERKKHEEEVEQDALSLIAAEISEATRTETLQNALTTFNQQLMALAHHTKKASE